MKIKNIISIVAISAILLGCAGCASGVGEVKSNNALKEDEVQKVVSVEKKELKIAAVLDNNEVYALKDSLAVNKKAPVPKSVTVDGQECKLSYFYNQDSDKWNHAMTVYTYDADGVKGEIGFADATGDVRHFERIDAPWDLSLPVLSTSEILDIAKKAFAEIAPDIDIDSYSAEMGKFDLDHSRPGRCFYYVYFIRYIEGVKTNDIIRIDVRDYGYVDAFLKEALGEFKDFKLPAVVKNGVAKKSAVDSIKSKYTIATPTQSKAIDESPFLVRLADGRYAVRYSIGVKNGSGYAGERRTVVLE